MPRRFTDAADLLGNLLDRHEAGAAAPLAYPDYAAFSSVNAADEFIRDLRTAADAGAVRLTHGKGRNSEHVAHIKLESAQALYRHLGRAPSGEVAEQARRRIVDGLDLHDHLIKASAEIASVWARGKSWNGFTSADAERVRSVLVLTQAILDGKHVGLDYRTFSRRFTGDSKILERLEGAVVRLVAGIREVPPGAKPRETLRTLGLEKFAPPLLISGAVSFDGVDLGAGPSPYLGIPPREAGNIGFNRKPSYFLTIENYASFNRHITEADPERSGTTVYVGGYPSLGTQAALRVLTAKLGSDTPVFHWSDIDADGTWIFRTIERAIGRTVQPHLMSPEIAEKFGKPADVRQISGCPPESGIAILAAYLAREGAKTLEQEELDPARPIAHPEQRTPPQDDHA